MEIDINKDNMDAEIEMLYRLSTRRHDNADIGNCNTLESEVFQKWFAIMI